MTERGTTVKPDPTAEAVAVAVGRLGEATAIDIAAAAGVAYSTTTKKLRALAGAGRVEPFDGPNKRTLWRPIPDPATATRITDAAAAAAAPAELVPPADPPDADAGTDVGLASTTPPVAVPEPADPATAPTAPPPAAAVSTGPGTERRAAGSLRGAVLDILEADPDRQYKVAELCKLIDAGNTGTGAAKASQGAVYNAVVKLVGAHRAVQTVDKPATFQLAGSSTAG